MKLTSEALGKDSRFINVIVICNETSRKFQSMWRIIEDYYRQERETKMQLMGC